MSRNRMIKVEKLLTRKLVIWNLVIFVLVKVVFSYSGFQLANLVSQIELFSSQDIVAQTNVERKANNLPPLRTSSRLDLAAEEKLKDMIQDGYFAHISPDGTTPWFWIKNAAYQYIYAGENLAIGFTDAKEAVEAWMNSPSHKANLLNNKYEEIGVAVGQASNINGYSGILVVQMFGKPIIQTAMAGEENAVLTTTKPSPSQTPETRTSVAGITPEASVAPTTKLAGNTDLVRLQQISTDESISPISKPITNKDSDDEAMINQISKNINNAFVSYTFILALLSAVFLIFVERKRKYAMGVAFNVLLFVAAFSVPVFQVVKSAIF